LLRNSTGISKKKIDTNSETALIKKASVQGLKILLQFGYVYTILLASSNILYNIALKKPLFTKFTFFENAIIETALDNFANKTLNFPHAIKILSSALLFGYPAFFCIRLLQKQVVINAKNNANLESALFYVVFVAASSATTSFYLQKENSDLKSFSKTFKTQFVIGILFPFFLTQNVFSSIKKTLEKTDDNNSTSSFSLANFTS
jgi:hypothetical protein